MCGICGIYNLNDSPIDPEVLYQMMLIQRHRGPDDQGMRLFSLDNSMSNSEEISRNCSLTKKYEGGLGFNRLSILDLSKNGHQPMCNNDGSVFIALNGEIYNAFDYKSELESAGFNFKSNSDTEVILYLYERYGFSEMLERLNGMFAICIVDLKKKCIYLVRDRFGIKPLYWYEDQGTFLFSSEVKSFFYHPKFKSELDIENLDEYFVFRYCAWDRFLLKGVHQLEPGHWVVLNSSGWKKYKYWDLATNNRNNISFNLAIDEFEEHMQRSVKMRLLSDVKVGCQLSGGIDSSLINHIACKNSEDHMNAFSIIFNDPNFSEEKWIDEAIIKTKVRCYKYNFSSADFIDNLFRATWHLDQPLNHPNSLGIYHIAKNAKKLVTVLLSGEGADELLGGYTRYLYALMRPKLKPFNSIFNNIPYVGNLYSKKFGDLNKIDHITWYILQSSFMDSKHFNILYPDASYNKTISNRRSFFDESDESFIDQCFNYEMQTYLVDLLIRQDKMTMAHSIENRVPFLDHELVRFIRSLPDNYLINLNPKLRRFRMKNTKIILKKLGLKYFNTDFVYRSKVGFAFPLKSYYMEPKFQEIMNDIILPGIHNRGIIEYKVVKDWWGNIHSATNEVCESLWICIAFEIWSQQFLDKNFHCIN